MKINSQLFGHQKLAGLAVALQIAGAALAADTNLITIKVGHLPVPGHAKFFVAKEEGFFQEAGLNVELVNG